MMRNFFVVIILLLSIPEPLLAEESWGIDGIVLYCTTEDVNRSHGNPKYFEIEGFGEKQRPIRSYYGERKTLPAIEWDDEFRVTRVTGKHLEVSSLSIRVGDSQGPLRKALGAPVAIQGNIFVYQRPSSVLQVYFDKEGKIKMFDLRAKTSGVASP